jgi:hypothetical protein
MINNKKQRGLLSVEVIIALGVMVTLISVIAALGSAFGKLNNQLWLRHTCMTAGQAQMDAIFVLGRPIEDEKFHELWPQVTCFVERTDGNGLWQGLEKVNLHLSAGSKRDTVTVTLNRYMAKDRKVQP